MSTVMPAALRKDICAALIEYLSSVVEDEFPAMAKGATANAPGRRLSASGQPMAMFSPTTSKCRSITPNHSNI